VETPWTYEGQPLGELDPHYANGAARNSPIDIRHGHAEELPALRFRHKGLAKGIPGERSFFA
jgi:hypothetical protein